MRSNAPNPVNGLRPISNGALTRKRVVTDLRSIGFKAPIVSLTVRTLRNLNFEVYNSYLGYFKEIYDHLEMSPMVLYLRLPRAHQLTWMAKNMDVLKQNRSLIVSNFLDSKSQTLDLVRLPILFPELLEKNPSS